MFLFFFFFSSRRRHTRSLCDWSSDVCSSDLGNALPAQAGCELEPFAHYIGLRDLPTARFFLNVRHQWLRQSYRESLHEVSVIHLRQACKTDRTTNGGDRGLA